MLQQKCPHLTVRRSAASMHDNIVIALCGSMGVCTDIRSAARSETYSTLSHLVCEAFVNVLLEKEIVVMQKRPCAHGRAPEVA